MRYGVLLIMAIAGIVRGDVLPVAHWDAARFDWTGSELPWQKAIAVVDARTEERTNVEFAITSATWNDVIFDGGLADTPWAGAVGFPQGWIEDGKEYTWGVCHYTPLSRTHPTVAPLLQVTDIKTQYTEHVIGWVPKGKVWVHVAVATGTFFQSPATATIAGQDLSDSSEMPNFDGLPPIPEPASLALLALGGAAGLRRRS